MICTKASQNLGFIKRNLNGTPQELKYLAYIALVRSGLKYACTVLDPYYIKDNGALERI